MSTSGDKQSRIVSAVESTLNISTGFLVSWFVWSYIVPISSPSLTLPASQNVLIVCLFTVSSWLRSYGWRRFFAAGLHGFFVKKIKEMAVYFPKNSL